MARKVDAVEESFFCKIFMGEMKAEEYITVCYGLMSARLDMYRII